MPSIVLGATLIVTIYFNYRDVNTTNQNSWAQLMSPRTTASSKSVNKATSEGKNYHFTIPQHPDMPFVNTAVSYIQVPETP